MNLPGQYKNLNITIITIENKCAVLFNKPFGKSDIRPNVRLIIVVIFIMIDYKGNDERSFYWSNNKS